MPKYKQQLDEDADDVKEMNKRMMAGKVQYIRDKQIEENNALEAEYINQQKALERMMEIERLKLIQDDQEREARRVAARKHGQQVLIEQMQERQ